LNEEKWLDVAETAVSIGLSERQTRRLCEDDKLIYRKEGKAYFIDPASVEQFISNRLSANPDGDIRTSSADVERTSDIDADVLSDMPADIAALSRRLWTSIQAVRTSHDDMSDMADQFFQRLAFEHRRNRTIEECLQEIIVDLNLQPKMRPWQSKLYRKSRAILPWILFGISSGTALLLVF